jgi:NhaP-type Na+/H+ or K+/H+ antiporter
MSLVVDGTQQQQDVYDDTHTYKLDEHQPLILFFIIFALLVGGLLRELHKKMGFPYTPMLFGFGFLIGCFRHHLGILGESAITVSQMHPKMMLFIFIPVLIFEAGFKCDWYVFKRAMVSILTLGVPGVLVTSL